MSARYTLLLFYLLPRPPRRSRQPLNSSVARGRCSFLLILTAPGATQRRAQPHRDKGAKFNPISDENADQISRSRAVAKELVSQSASRLVSQSVMRLTGCRLPLRCATSRVSRGAVSIFSAHLGACSACSASPSGRPSARQSGLALIYGSKYRTRRPACRPAGQPADSEWECCGR